MLTLALLTASSSQSAVSNAKIEKEISHQVSRLWKAWETSDRALAESVYHHSFTDVDFSGERRSREQVLAFLPPVRPAPNSSNQTQITISDHSFVHNDDTVIVSYLGEDRRFRDGIVVARWQFRANDTFVKDQGRWMLLAGQQALLGIPDTEAEILAAQERFARAVLVGDVDTVGRLLHDKWVFTAPAGWQADKGKFLHDMTTIWKPSVQRYEGAKVVVAGTSAVVTGRVFFEWKGGSAEEQFTDTYSYSGYGSWLRLSSHHSCVKGNCSE